MRIMHIIPSGDPRDGGPIEAARRIGTAWRAMGHVQHIVTLDSPDEPFLSDFKPPVIALGGRRLRLGRFRRFVPYHRFRYTPGAVRWIRNHAREYDVIVVSSLWNYATMAARRALAGGPHRYFVFTHGMLDPWFAATYPWKHRLKMLFWRFNEGPLLKNATAVLFTTEEERLLARQSFSPYDVVEKVVPYGSTDVPGNRATELAAFYAAVPEARGTKLLLFMSRIHYKKGCDLLIEAFARVANDYPGWKLILAGPDQTGWSATLRNQAERLGISDRISWPGMLTGDAKWGAYHACEAMILPSHQENFGIVVAEAMACGKPVLITDKVNLWREVDREGGGLVRPDSQQGIDALVRDFLAMSEAEQEAMGARARQCFETHFRIERCAAQMIEVFEAAIGGETVSPGQSPG